MTWRSSEKMAANRPVLGYGVNGFRYAYPAYQELGQNDGRITNITESEIALVEIISDGIGGYVERPAAVALAD